MVLIDALPIDDQITLAQRLFDKLEDVEDEPSVTLIASDTKVCDDDEFFAGDDLVYEPVAFDEGWELPRTRRVTEAQKQLVRRDRRGQPYWE